MAQPRQCLEATCEPLDKWLLRTVKYDIVSAQDMECSQNLPYRLERVPIDRKDLATLNNLTLHLKSGKKCEASRSLPW